MNYFKIFNIPKNFILLIVLAIVLNILRIFIWKSDSFVYILWNIFLALVPFFISQTLFIFSEGGKLNKKILFIGIFVWILFIPNAPYLVTDFIHLGEIRIVPRIYDVFLLFISAYIGLFLFFQSLFHIEQIIKKKYSSKITYTIVGFIILLISFGIYLGRFLRLNSWDIFIDHISLIKNIWKTFSKSGNFLEVLLYTLLFFVSILSLYISWRLSKEKAN